MKQSLIIVVLIGLIGTMSAQQDPQYTQWMFDKLSYNPAMAGLGGCCGGNMNSLSMFYRDQWDGLDQDPKTAMLNFNSQKLDFLNGSGVGFTFYNDHLGQETNNIFRGSFAKHIDVNGDTFSIGAAVGFYSKKLGNAWIAIDPVILDPVIPNQESSDGSVDLSLGVVYERANEFYIGASMTHLTGSDLEELSITMARHGYFMAGYNFSLGSPDLVLRTNLLAKTDLNVATIDVNANVLINNMVWAGLSFRPGDALAPGVGYQTSWTKKDGYNTVNNCLMVGYTYDLTTSEIKNYSSGSHELFVTYCFNIFSNPPQNRHSNPRFL